MVPFNSLAKFGHSARIARLFVLACSDYRIESEKIFSFKLKRKLASFHAYVEWKNIRLICHSSVVQAETGMLGTFFKGTI